MTKETEAWKWLLDLERISWEKCGFRARDRQIIIRVCPGELHANSGAPLVQVSVKYPGVKNRVKTQGNSLAKAVYLLHYELELRGVELPYPFTYLGRY